MENLPTVRNTQTQIQQFNFEDIEKIGEYIAKSRLFGVDQPEQAIALCLIAHAEGQHPALAAQDYDIIQGKPSLKSKAMLTRFQDAGGRVEWHQHDDDACEATFSHEVGGTLTIRWDMDRAKQAGLTNKDNWRKYPRAMLRARTVSEGVSAVYPGAARFYTPEEVQDFTGDEFNKPPARDITDQVDSGKPEKKKPESEPAEPPAAEDDVTAKLEAARAAAAERNADPETEPAKDDPADAFPEPTGKKLTKKQKDPLFAAFKGHGIEVKDLERWRGLTHGKWTESVLDEMRNLFKGFKAGEWSKEMFLKYLEDIG